MDFDIVIHNGTLITVNAADEIIGNGIIGIRADRLVHIGAGSTGRSLPRGRQIIDARGGIVMPGLINTHTHLPMALFRGLADDLALDVWLKETIFPAESRHIHPTTVRWATLLACAEMLLAGTTTCCDGYFLEDTVAAAVRESGLRAILGQGVIDFPAPGVPNPSANIETARAFVQKWSTGTPGIRPSIFCHSPYTCSARTLQQAKSVADEKGLLFQIHAAETRREWEQIQAEQNTTPIGYLSRLGLLDENTLLVHCVWVDASDIDLIARQRAGVSHNPESNMKLASGIAPVPQLLKAGVAVGLGTDGCASNNDLDLFGEMDMAAKLHKAATHDPTVMNAHRVVKMATLGGARALGLAEQIGSLEVGKQADLIVVGTHRPHLVPLYDPESHIVYAARGADVSDVVVAGKIVVQNRNVLSLDVAQIMAEVRAIARTIRAG